MNAATTDDEKSAAYRETERHTMTDWETRKTTVEVGDFVKGIGGLIGFAVKIGTIKLGCRWVPSTVVQDVHEHEHPTLTEGLDVIAKSDAFWDEYTAAQTKRHGANSAENGLASVMDDLAVMLVDLEQWPHCAVEKKWLIDKLGAVIAAGKEQYGLE